MTTLLNLFHSIPALIGAFLIAITLVVIFAPWNKILWAILWTLYVTVMFCWYYASEGWKRYKAWLKKPEPWYGDFDDMFI